MSNGLRPVRRVAQKFCLASSANVPTSFALRRPIAGCYQDWKDIRSRAGPLEAKLPPTTSARCCSGRSGRGWMLTTLGARHCRRDASSRAGPRLRRSCHRHRRLHPVAQRQRERWRQKQGTLARPLRIPGWPVVHPDQQFADPAYCGGRFQPADRPTSTSIPSARSPGTLRIARNYAGRNTGGPDHSHRRAWIAGQARHRPHRDKRRIIRCFPGNDRQYGRRPTAVRPFRRGHRPFRGQRATKSTTAE